MNLKFWAPIRTVACALAFAFFATMAPAAQLNLKQIAGINSSVVTALNNATNAASGLVALDPSGNLGLGITAATHIHSYLASGTNTLRVQSGATGVVDLATDGTNGFLTAYNNGSLNLSASGTGALNAYTNGALRLSISSAGAVSIGGSLGASTFTGSGSGITGLVAANMAVSQPDANAVSRTAQSKGSDIISVLDFLPVGQPDGTTENSTGFQYVATAACVRSADGADIFVPAPPSAHDYVAHDVVNYCPNLWAGGGRGGRGGTQTTRGVEYTAPNSSTDSITSFSGSASPYTIGFAANLNLKVGSTVTVASATPSTLNGTYTVTASSAGSITATTPQTGTWTSGGTVTGQTAYMGGTTINYSAATAFFMRWTPNKNGTLGSTWYTSTSPQQLMLGGGISDMTLFAGTNDTSKFALQVYGTFNFSAERLGIIAPYNGMEFYGAEFPQVSDILMTHTSNYNYYIHGDLNGLTSYGVAPAAGTTDTSTRVDQFMGRNLQNIDNQGTNSGFYIVGFVDGVLLDHVGLEGPAYGLNVSCPAYNSVTPNFDPNMGNCPHFIFTYDFQAENCAISCIHATDFLALRLHQAYLSDQSVSGATNTAYFSSANYTSSTTPPGRVTIDGGTLVFAAQADNIVFNGTLDDIDVNHSEINGGNIANSGGYGINFQGTITHLKAQSNTIGNVDGYHGANYLTGGVLISSGSSFGDVSTNIFDGVLSTNAPVVNNSSNKPTIHIHDNVGPGAGPNIGAATCGTVSINADARDDNFVLNITGGTPTACTVPFGTKRSGTTVCSVTLAPGATAFTSVSASILSVTINGSGLGGSYSVQCKDS